MNIILNITILKLKQPFRDVLIVAVVKLKSDRKTQKQLPRSCRFSKRGFYNKFHKIHSETPAMATFILQVEDKALLLYKK